MGEVRGFLDYPRQVLKKQPVHERIQHYKEFIQPYAKSDLRTQGARCMDCGVAFCHNGCPLGNLIPNWNHLVSEEHYKAALESLLSTNNFPEFTGRICPAPCESACVLGINEDPVAIEGIEMALADMGFARGWIKAERPSFRSGKTVAVIGSGPAGLAAAQELNRAGHSVTVFEKADRPGGLMMYGIPDFKLEKSKIERRIQLLQDEGIRFQCNVNVGVDIAAETLHAQFDAVLLTVGAGSKRDIQIPGRQFKGVHFAEDLLSQSTRRVMGDAIHSHEAVYANDKDVIVIGGGDTGSDCVGTSRRQGARSITQFEIMTKPPILTKFPRAHERPEETAWPAWTHMLRTTSSHEEGANRHWSLETVAFEGNENGELSGLTTRELAWFTDDSGRRGFKAVEGSEKTWPCQMALIAVGFLGAERNGLASELELQFDPRGNIETIDYESSRPGVFAAGDARRGQSLVVWAIAEGREAARSVSRYLHKSIS